MGQRSRVGRSCPCCRADFDGRLDVPHVEADAKAWFKVVDFDNDGGLNQVELLEVLKATVETDVARLERDMPTMFPTFDPNGDGKIEYGEMMGPHGLFYHVRRMYRKSRPTQKFIPDIKVDKEAWFRYWDEDGSGTLDREEILRSLVKTFNLSANLEQLQALRGVLDALWYLFDPNGSGDIDMAEFCKRETGLADTLILNLALS